MTTITLDHTLSLYFSLSIGSQPQHRFDNRLFPPPSQRPIQINPQPVYNPQPTYSQEPAYASYQPINQQPIYNPQPVPIPSPTTTRRPTAPPPIRQSQNPSFYETINEYSSQCGIPKRRSQTGLIFNGNTAMKGQVRK